MSSFPECSTCGSTHYNLEDGIYFCGLCNTALQEVSQLIDDSQYHVGELECEETQAILEDNLLGSKKQDGRKLKFYLYTSWEVYNFALKGWVDQLISFGVDPKLKIVALQVWTKYLSITEAAFFSTEKEEKPRLGLKTKRIDSKILYGVDSVQRDIFGIPLKRRKVDKVEKNKSTFTSAILKKRRLNKDLTFMIEEENEEMDASNNFEEGGVDLENLKAKKDEENLVALNPIAQKLLEESLECNTVVNPKAKDTFLPLNFTTLIALLHIALVLINETLLISDLFRLAKENILSLRNIEKVVPLRVLKACHKSLSLGDQHLSRPDGVYASSRLLLSLFDIEYSIDLRPLCERYCKELQLPAPFLDWSLRLVTYRKNNHKLFKQDKYDASVLACIIVTAKMLFSLDDVTEIKQSKVADKINKIRKQNGVKEPILFAWESWRKYITSRKTVVALYHQSTFFKLYQTDRVNTSILLSQWQKQTRINSHQDHKLADYLATVLKELNPNLETNHGSTLDSLNINFKPSMTPLSDNLEQLLTHHEDRIPPVILSTLQKNFRDMSVDYLYNDNYVKRLSKQCAIDILVSDEMDDSINFNWIEAGQRLFNHDKRHSRLKETLDTLSFYEIDPHASYKQIGSEMNFLGLPPAAVKLLKKKLKVKGVLKFSRTEERNSKPDKEVKDGKSSSAKKIEINRASSHYWISHLKPWNIAKSGDPSEFLLTASKLLPTSFVWLLQECCDIIDCNITDLYREVCFVENMIMNQLKGCIPNDFLSSEED